MADLGEETDVDYSEENEETEEESQPVTNPLQPQAKPKKKKKEKKEMDMQKAQMEIQNKYYQKKLQQQSQRIKLLESQVEKLEPIENKKLSSLIINMQKTVKGFVTYVQKNPTEATTHTIVRMVMKGPCRVR